MPVCPVVTLWCVCIRVRDGVGWGRLLAPWGSTVARDAGCVGPTPRFPFMHTCLCVRSSVTRAQGCLGPGSPYLQGQNPVLFRVPAPSPRQRSFSHDGLFPSFCYSLSGWAASGLCLPSSTSSSSYKEPHLGVRDLPRLCVIGPVTGLVLRTSPLDLGLWEGRTRGEGLHFRVER